MSALLAAAVDFQAQPTTTVFQRDYRLSKYRVPSCDFEVRPRAERKRTCHAQVHLVLRPKRDNNSYLYLLSLLN